MQCIHCRFYKHTDIFDLCKHEQSTYKVGEKFDVHTIGHMRKHECGPDAKLFQPVESK